MGPDILHAFVFPQEDDIDGEHIVAFAEEDDPGLLKSAVC